MTITNDVFATPLDRRHSIDTTAHHPSSSYDEGYTDGRSHARLAKPVLCSPSDYGNGFFDGWKSIRYPRSDQRNDDIPDSTGTNLTAKTA
jgi:hypothetical protein